MARPVDPDSGFRVKIHDNGGHRYASTQPAFTDPATGRKKYRRLHWGVVDENNKFHPDKNYLLASPEERAKLIFPEDWDLSEVASLTGNRKRGRPVIESQDENRLYGDIWLLEKIADQTGIRDDLMTVFDNDLEKVNAVLTLAYFPMSGKGTYHQLAAWQRIAKTPYRGELSSPYITALTQKITEQDRMALLRLRAKRLSKQELCAVDSTSRSAWGSSLADIHYGKNKDHLPLPQTLEVVVYTLDHHMPVYYRTFAGNTPDSRSLETILNDLEQAGFRDIVLITDRGYESVRNLEMYIDKGQRMIMGAKVGQKLILDKIQAFGNFGAHPDGMEVAPDERFYYKQYDVDYQIEGKRDNVKKSERLEINLYFDPIRRGQEILDIDINVRNQQAALTAIQKDQSPLDDDQTIHRAYNFFKLDYDPVTRVLKNFSLNQKKIDQARRTAGFFANITHGMKLTPIEAHHHYLLRDEQEKYFAMMKSIMGADRQRNSSESGKAGRLFILFVSQIIGSYLSYIRKAKLSDQFHSVSDILNEMRPIRYIEHPNTVAYITPFVGKQVAISEAFDFDIPEGCAPEYVVRKTNKGKRGRPRKNKQVVKEESET